jgi:predicted porin
MNKLLLTAALALALVPNAHGQAAASSGPLGDLKVSGDFDYESQYVFRGKKITNSAFQPSVDFSKTVADGTLKAYVWTSQPIGRAGNPSSTFPSTTVGPNQNNEIDIGAYWQHSIPGVDSLTGEVGYQMYWYPDLGGAPVASRTHEFHVGAIYDTTNVLNKINLSPTVYLYHDVILDSNTITGAISYSWDLSDSVTKGLSLNPTATIGWTGAHRSFGDVSGQNWGNSYSFWELDLELDYVLSSNTTVYVAGHYAGNNDGTRGGFGGVASNPNAPGSQNQLWLGLGVKWNM